MRVTVTLQHDGHNLVYAEVDTRQQAPALRQQILWFLRDLAAADEKLQADPGQPEGGGV